MEIEPNLPLSHELHKTMWSMTKQNTVITHEDKMEIMVKSSQTFPSIELHKMFETILWIQRNQIMETDKLVKEAPIYFSDIFS